MRFALTPPVGAKRTATAPPVIREDPAARIRRHSPPHKAAGPRRRRPPAQDLTGRGVVGFSCLPNTPILIPGWYHHHMPTEELYPYRLRVSFTAQQEAGLRASAVQNDAPITEMIRRYVADGIKRDGITATVPVIDGQTTITD